MVVQASQPQLDLAFRALGDATRRDIVRRTASAGASVSQLAAAYDMSFAAVQKHVAVLQRAGLIDKTAVGRQRIVHAVPDQLARVRECLEQLEGLWRDRITSLDALLSDTNE